MDEAIRNAIDEYIENQLPIYLLQLEGMKLVRRGSVKANVQDALAGFIEEILPSDGYSEWRRLTEGEVQAKAEAWIREQTAYSIFSHRWLNTGELTFQDVMKLEKVSVQGLRVLSKDRRTRRTGREILDFLASYGTKVEEGKGEGKRTKGKDKEDEDDQREEEFALLRGMKGFCDALSAKQRSQCQDLIKLVEFCNISSQYDCKYVWFDTGCIDKSRSAELEESIRSMFNWYRDARICIVHLAGTTIFDAGSAVLPIIDLGREPWFKRGWTLQELLAPKRILFFDSNWRRITRNTEGNDKAPADTQGTRLWEVISKATGIRTDKLLNFTAGIEHARDALAWVSKRKTTRIEDMAYCLIGLLQIPMSIAYGEGAMAFYRLQVEILQRSGDMGLFAWTGHPSPFNSMLAANPSCFTALPLSNSQPLEAEPARDNTFSWDKARSIDRAYMLTNQGLRIPLVVYGAEIRVDSDTDSVAVSAVEGDKITLRLTELDREISVVVAEEENLEDYHHLGVAILTGLSDESHTLAILLGIRGDRCTRIPTIEHIVLSPIKRIKKPVVRYIE